MPYPTWSRLPMTNLHPSKHFAWLNICDKGYFYIYDQRKDEKLGLLVSVFRCCVYTWIFGMMSKSCEYIFWTMLVVIFVEAWAQLTIQEAWRESIMSECSTDMTPSLSYYVCFNCHYNFLHFWLQVVEVCREWCDK